MAVSSDLSIIPFKSQAGFEKWLAANHAKQQGLWLQIFKKTSGVESITYDEALDVALCYGWIDGQIKKHDEHSWLRKFTPRGAKSIWSKKNIEHVERLIKLKKMKPAGLKEVDAAKKDGRWHRAYDSPSKMQLPEDFVSRLAENTRAKAFFETLNKANVYAITWRLQTAVKPETRAKRMDAILEMLESGKKFH